MSGRCCRCGCVGQSVCGSTPTRRSSPKLGLPSPGPQADGKVASGSTTVASLPMEHPGGEPMAGIKQDDNGKWKVDRAFLTPERAAILQQLEKKHEAARATRQNHD